MATKEERLQQIEEKELYPPHTVRIRGITGAGSTDTIRGFREDNKLLLQNHSGVFEPDELERC